METKEKKNKGLLIVVIIFGLIIIGLCIYISHLKINESTKKDTNNNNVIEGEENKDDIIVLDVKSEEVKKIWFNVQLGGLKSMKFFEQDKLFYETMTDADKIALVIEKYIRETPNFYVPSGDTWYITTADFDRYFKLIFGDKTYDFKDVKALINGVWSFSYNNQTDKYEMVSAAGGSSPDKFYQEIISAKKYNDRIEIFEQNYYAKYISEECCVNENLKYDIYLKYSENKDNLIASSVSAKRSTLEDDFKEILNTYSDKLNTYKYTFNYDEKADNYYFNSIEKINK